MKKSRFTGEQIAFFSDGTCASFTCTASSAVQLKETKFLFYVGMQVFRPASDPMARYYFDVHDNGPAEWDESGSEHASRGAIESHARDLIKAAGLRQRARDTIGVTTTVIVHIDGGGIVLTATAKPGRAVEYRWTAE